MDDKGDDERDESLDAGDLFGCVGLIVMFCINPLAAIAFLFIHPRLMRALGRDDDD